MTEVLELSFKLDLTINNHEVNLRTIPLNTFNQFNTEVEEFISGSKEKVPLSDSHILLEDGSYKITVLLPLLLASIIKPDLQYLEKQDSLHYVDPRRAIVIRRWQERAKKEDNYSVSIESPKHDFKSISISNKTDYHTPEQNEWVAVERYLVGRVVDIGGVTKSNVHIVLEDSGKTLIAASDKDYLRDQRKNYLYHNVQLHVNAQQNIRTGELRDIILIAFIGEGPSYDEDELNQAIEKGTHAWADVPDSVKWVRDLRGDKDE